ncbi:TnsA-like heteromeric transposase endonuclease subunit [Streptomyces sp. H10-C2]|uniref:TnsA-like heteromeric transposase endonuclease subunit n=1 Tax=unclassified Streptomyces TaxID=2593676 RepID=UPI0024BB7D38|nr:MULTISPECIES: TnsA-like heteromeric transposase endonuclease subunit [unclassified Streptomyces]MDJ0342143.1 TnsA-like heteromeric transposase endonuclease subunit [Streptomyces sp. PH10-H1]MDJ0368657.1 TnsA-like heteromeric transposase endonuclease subunit [Streptomyces sp. H10-C2]
MDVGKLGQAAFEVGYVDEDCVHRREALAACWTLRFEKLSPVRTVKSYKGQRSVTRDYWAATTARQLSCESHLERHHAMLMDFDPQVTGLVGQPFRLFWPGRRGRRGHVPDFFARLDDGGGLVVDVRPDEHIEPDDAEAFAATARACELAGWAFRRVGAIDAVLLANTRWLAGYRHPRNHREPAASELAAVFAEPGGLLAGAERVGDRLAVLPVLYHLLWRRVLEVDLDSGLLGPRSVVRRAVTAR